MNKDNKERLLRHPSVDGFLAITKKRWKVFAIALLIQLTLVISGINPYSFWENIFKEAQGDTFKTGEPKVKIFDEIKLKLGEKVNSFSLRQKPELVGRVTASGNYENAKAYIVVDLGTGEILDSKNSDSKIPIASLTKVMTAVVALDLAAPSEEFEVTNRASRMIPTKIGVVPGEKMTLDELLNALLLTSANDAAEVIKEGVDSKYGEKIFKSDSYQSLFIRAMNEKAKLLGLRNTNFTNPQGFDNDRHYSSAADLAILSQYALSNYPEISDIVRDDYEFLPANSTHKQFDLYNWNGLLGVYPGAYGVKIGNTDKAHKTTIVAAQREGKKVLVVVLGAPTTLQRDLWAAELLDAGFANYNIEAVNITEKELKQKYSTWKYFN